jgi:hypothetical protein
MPLLIVLVCCFAVAAIVGTLALAWPSSSTTSDPVPAWATSPASPRPSYDQATVSACAYAQQVETAVAGQRDAQIVPSLGVKARESATISDVGALRDLAAQFEEAAVDTKIGRLEAANVALKIFQWCEGHGLGTR